MIEESEGGSEPRQTKRQIPLRLVRPPHHPTQARLLAIYMSIATRSATRFGVDAGGKLSRRGRRCEASRSLGLHQPQHALGVVERDAEVPEEIVSENALDRFPRDPPELGEEVGDHD